MRAVVIEVNAPCRHQIAGMTQAIEQVLVQAFITHPAIEAFDEAILHRIANRAESGYDNVSYYFERKMHAGA